MTDTADFLFELGTEELPPKALRKLSLALGEGIENGLRDAGLPHGSTHSYATPRRLAVTIEDLPIRTPDRINERRGPALKAAFDADGQPTKAALGFARSCDVRLEELETLETDKGSWLVFRATELGKPTRDLLPAIVERALSALPIPKRMRWADFGSEFVRPVHWLILLFDGEVVDTEILSVRSGQHTYGHRFHNPSRLFVADPRAYAPLLESEGFVNPDWELRREAIRAQVIETAASQCRGHALIDEHLLDEVAGLVEWPVALTGRFDERFLEIPAEVLISSMQDHQKYFPVTDGSGHLLPYFITIANIRSEEPEVVIQGNERVIRPRLEDADFFWNQDRKRSLKSRIEQLAQVTFQHRLGSLYDKAQRVSRLAECIAKGIGGNPELALTAAMLAKTDLLTDMVGEFPALQGTMGRYYALHDGEPKELADAMEEQYLPRFAGDGLPETATGQALALADRIDTLIGIFGIEQPPSGDKDPFGLRRAAIGVLRILVEKRLDLDLEVLLQTAYDQFQDLPAKHTVRDVFDYITERQRGYYLEQGFRHDECEAVIKVRPARPLDFDARIQAVAAFRALPEADSLAAANKRIGNILRKATESLPELPDPALFSDPAETALHDIAAHLVEDTRELIQAGSYEAALRRLASLRDDVDRFFDDVMVNVDDEAVRRNRLSLVRQVRNLFLSVADISSLQG
jgi:glycyl-tRNA synthetase beta chain